MSQKVSKAAAVQVDWRGTHKMYSIRFTYTHMGLWKGLVWNSVLHTEFQEFATEHAFWQIHEYHLQKSISYNTASPRLLYIAFSTYLSIQIIYPLVVDPLHCILIFWLIWQMITWCQWIWQSAVTGNCGWCCWQTFCARPYGVAKKNRVFQ